MRDLQDDSDGHTKDDKMRWLDSNGGGIYYGEGKWDTAPYKEWGIISIGSFYESPNYNVRIVEEMQTFELKLKGESEKGFHLMGKVRCFSREDMGKSLEELLSLGLVDRCFTAGTSGSNIFDTKQGIVYSPSWGSDWIYVNGSTPQPEFVWMPMSRLAKL